MNRDGIAGPAPPGLALEHAAALALAVLWVLPLAYAVWAAFHPPEFAARFAPLAPLTLENFRRAWEVAPFARYVVNTVMLVTMVLAAQFALCTLAAYAFARLTFPGRDVAFALVLVQILNLAAAVSNVRIMESDPEQTPYRDELFTRLPEIEQGSMKVPTAPGWGTELNEKAAQKYAWTG